MTSSLNCHLSVKEMTPLRFANKLQILQLWMIYLPAIACDDVWRTVSTFNEIRGQDDLNILVVLCGHCLDPGSQGLFVCHELCRRFGATLADAGNDDNHLFDLGIKEPRHDCVVARRGEGAL